MSKSIRTLNGTYEFEGPHRTVDPLSNSSGVYVITTVDSAGSHLILDVGESHNIKDRVANHDRSQSWKNHKINGVYALVLYCDESNRMLIEKQIRDFHNPPCGDR